MTREPQSERIVRFLRSRWFKIPAVLVGLVFLAGGAIFMSAWEAMGARPDGTRLEAMQASPQWKDGRFHNPLERIDGSYVKMLGDWFRGSSHRTPEVAPPVAARTRADYETPPPGGLRITWLGHSTTLVEIDGARVLLDPVWSTRAAPMTWAGPKRFHAPPLPRVALPARGAVVVSHDPYDHLDHRTIQALADRVPRFLVPLGVGAHLEYWGVAADRITELDWWDAVEVGPLTLTATPARHFSGRSLVMADVNRTLWAGWAIQGPEHRVYYSGDTALFPDLAEIGARLGPFDAALIETGAYNKLWADVHIGPEQAVVACQMVRGAVLLPVHWGTFDLAIHSWVEPVERVLAAASIAGVSVAVPRPGQPFIPAEPPALVRWWEEIPWQRADVNPVISSGLEDALSDRVRALSNPG